MSNSKYTFKEKLEITESIVTILMFFMAVWGTIIAIEAKFWHKLDYIVNHYHKEIIQTESHNLLSRILDKENHSKSSDTDKKNCDNNTYIYDEKNKKITSSKK